MTEGNATHHCPRAPFNLFFLDTTVSLLTVLPHIKCLWADEHWNSSPREALPHCEVCSKFYPCSVSHSGLIKQGGDPEIMLSFFQWRALS